MILAIQFYRNCSIIVILTSKCYVLTCFSKTKLRKFQNARWSRTSENSCKTQARTGQFRTAAAPVSDSLIIIVQPYGTFPSRHVSWISPHLLACWLLQQTQLRDRKQEVMAHDESILKGSEKYPKPANRTFQYGTAGVCQMS